MCLIKYALIKRAKQGKGVEEMEEKDTNMQDSGTSLASPVVTRSNIDMDSNAIRLN